MSSEEGLVVKFWGVRGSHPTPGQNTVNVGGNTACVEIQAGEHNIILDAGTGIIELGRDLLHRAEQSRKAGRAGSLAPVILLSHLHHDHTQGLPFFLPAYLPMARVSIYGPHPGDENLEAVLAQVVAPPVFPLRLDEISTALEIRSIGDGYTIRPGDGGRNGAVICAPDEKRAVGVGETVIRVLRSYAHPGGVFVFRIERNGSAVVYATDTEGYYPVDRRLAEFAQNADLLIHDAQYTEDHYLGNGGRRSTQGWGHSTPHMACMLARAANVRRLALFHYDPTYGDEQVAEMEAAAVSEFAGAFAAREYMKVDLGGRRNQTCVYGSMDFAGAAAGSGA